MAAIPLCYKMSYKSQSLSAAKIPKGFNYERHIIHEGFRCLSSISSNISGRWKVVLADTIIASRKGSKSNADPENSFQKEQLYPICYYSLESKSSVKHQILSDSYLEKLQNETKHPTSNSTNDTTQHGDKGSLLKARKALGSLDAYLAALTEDAKSEKYESSASIRNSADGDFESTISDTETGQTRRLTYFVRLENMESDNYKKKSAVTPLDDESSDLYIISILASINIAVSLFEMASPIKNSDYDLYSLPLMYGAKVNHLILVGEWWRLVTPMFLHSGLLHVALSCWVLISFGPQVCKGYGLFTFFLIYILGGISGNLTSFLHTPEATVGGSGPVFAIIGAWLIYQMQNKDMISKEISEELFQKAMVAMALSCLLANFGPIDSWANVGATFTGIIFGFFTCPMQRMDNASSKTMQEEGIALVRQHANPCKSLAAFAFFGLVLCSLLYFTEPPLNTMGLEDLLKMSE